MARNNDNLHKARKAKNDEFYTRYEDIENEVQHYASELKGKWIYCPCDDYEWSNFVKYFKDNFSRYELKHLTATHIHMDGTPSERYDYDGVNESITMLNGNGDFRSEECSRIKDAADIVITNPPFSLFREFIGWLNEKKFLVLGNLNLTTIMMEMLLKGKMWCGTKYKGGNAMWFNYQGNEVEVPALFWTNLNYDFEKPFVELTKTYNPVDYPKYDNYDAIEVSKAKNIPMDYTGLMGVPLSFIYKLNQNQFELVDIWCASKILNLNGRTLYTRLIIRNKHPVQNENIVNNSVDE